MSDYDPIRERADEFAAQDHRNPIRIEPGYHTTRIAAGTPSMDATDIGFYDQILHEDHHGLEEGQWLTVEHPNGAGTDRYQMQVTPVPGRLARDILHPDEIEAFRAGDALVAGAADHRELTYNPIKVDDRIMRETVHRSSLVTPGEQVNMWTVADVDDLPWKTYGDLGSEFTGMRDDDHPVHVT